MKALAEDPGYNEAMADLADCIERTLRALGVAGDPALLADLLVAAARREFPGDSVYFTKLDASNRHARNAAIQREHQRGTPVRRLAKRYRMTPAMIYAIVRKPARESVFSNR